MRRSIAMGMAVVVLGALTTSARAQVFSAAPGATTGEISAGDGEALYGTFGLSAASNPDTSYSIYRKFQGGNSFPEPLEIHVAENVPNNPSLMEWSGLHQGGPSNGDTGFLAPGVYIGNSTSTSSYDGQLVKFGGVTDGESSTGDVSADTDSEGRRDWDLRFAFLESPDDFIDRRDPNNGSWDLWDGNWGSDGVMLHFGVGANIDEDAETGTTDWYVYPREDTTSFTAQSGDDLTVIGNQGNRDGMEFTGRRVASGDEIDTEFSARFEAGVSYEGYIEASWKMELNDPENADPVQAREVKLSAKVGNIIYEGVFDPGSADDPIEPNPFADPDTFYTDGFFDWQNAVPAMYVGASNGTSADATALQGFFIPGDINSDGVADNADMEALNSFLGQSDTTYSRGDLDQDGDTDETDMAILQGLISGGTPGDYNNDGAVDVLDIDLQAGAIADPAPDLATYDENGDGVVDIVDRGIWVEDHRNTYFGDANLDNEFNSGDLVAVFAGGKYETGEMASWAQGDWNGDLAFDSGDLVVAFADGGYEQGPRPAGAAVPEPSSLVLVVLGIMGLIGIVRRR